jgi:putative restriction endonuclease
VDGRRIPLINPQRGIFKPAAMQYLLSVRTVYPVTGRRVWYDDQQQVHAQLERGEELIDYAFMGTDPEAADNRWLREARDAQIPILYFLGIAPQRYTAIWPTYIADWSAADLKARLAFGAPVGAAKTWSLPDAPERRYGLRLVRQRLHQASFREAVLTAYGQRCAISGLPEPRLLDAAHIIADRDEGLGQPVVRNGLPLSKIHHAAFDANLIGIDPDFQVHVGEALLAMHDGPLFEHGIKASAGRLIRLPDREIDDPDRERLAERFARLRAG